MEWDSWCNRIGVQWEGIASCGPTFDSVLEQHWLQDHIGSNYHTCCTESTALPGQMIPRTWGVEIMICLIDSMLQSHHLQCTIYDLLTYNEIFANHPHTIHQAPRNWRCRRTWIDYDAVGIVNTLLSEVGARWLATGWDYSIRCGDSGVNVAASLDYNYLHFLLCVTFVACVNLGMLKVLLGAWYCLLCFTGKWC